MFVAGESGIRFTNRLGKPLMGDDGIIYSCSGKFLYAFKSNGSMLWNAHLNYTCNGKIAPVYGGEGRVNGFIIIYYHYYCFYYLVTR